eukprot:3640231-Alexandrium_andersonii.AAC.1
MCPGSPRGGKLRAASFAKARRGVEGAIRDGVHEDSGSILELKCQALARLARLRFAKAGSICGGDAAKS